MKAEGKDERSSTNLSSFRLPPSSLLFRALSDLFLIYRPQAKGCALGADCFENENRGERGTGNSIRRQISS